MTSSAVVLILLTFVFGTIVAQCPSGFTAVSGECFLFENDFAESMSAGQLLCELKGGRLAFIDDCQVLSDVVQHIQENGLTSSSGYWLGGTDLRVEGTFEWFNKDSVPMGMPFWGAPGGIWQPAGGVEQNCLAMNAADGYFFGDFECELPFGALCQPAGETTDISTVSPSTSTSTSTPWWGTSTPWYTTGWWYTTSWWPSTTRERTSTTTPQTTTGPARCPAGFQFVSSRCLRFLDDVTDSWSSGELRCQVIDAHLAAVEGCHQLGEVVQHINYTGYSPNSGFWLGATDLEVEGRFEWINGGVVSLRMPLWGTESGHREPSGGEAQNCLAMIRADRYYFHDRPCTDPMGVICEVPPITTETNRRIEQDLTKRHR